MIQARSNGSPKRKARATSEASATPSPAIRAPISLLLALALVAICGCQRSQPSTGVLLMAAASTRDAVTEIATQFRKHGIDVKVNAGSSATLAAQLVEGSPGDLFLSANEKWADHIKEKGLSAESRLLLSNKLVLIVPANNPAMVVSPDDLTIVKVKKIALAGEKAPAGIYARQALTKLNLLNKVAERIVSGEDVRFALGFVERGEAEAGIVYDTDALISDKVKQIYTFPADTHDPIHYPLVLLKAGKANEAARKFYDYLASPDAAAVFSKHGFTVLK